jgi:hypothetical protein
MDVRFDNLKKQMLRLLAELKPMRRAEQYNCAVEEVEAGEPGVALHAVCDNLYDYEGLISRRIYEDIKELASTMGMAERTWTMLTSRVSPE